MSFSFAILASGSSGNCSVVRLGNKLVLIDCGISPNKTAERMRALGVRLTDVAAICLTHLDSDHFHAGWIKPVCERRLSVFCAPYAVEELLGRSHRRAFGEQVRPFNIAGFEPIAGIRARAMRLPHDQEGSHAFILSAGGSSLGYATDLGRVSTDLIDAFAGVDLLAIESNYDPEMQRQSRRPVFLQQRIMGGNGHLSNMQALMAVREILDRAESRRYPLPQQIMLLHRSRQCNCPTIVRQLFSTDPRIAPRLVLAEQDVATRWFDAPRRSVAASAEPISGQQLTLQWA